MQSITFEALSSRYAVLLLDAFGLHSVLVGAGVNGTALPAVPAMLRPTYRLASLQEAE